MKMFRFKFDNSHTKNQEFDFLEDRGREGGKMGKKEGDLYF